MSTSGTIIRVLNQTGDACCPCPDQVDCSCSPYPTALSCRFKSGIAELCGYDEFGTASDPPRKYRTLTYSGSMVVCGPYDTSACALDICPANYNESAVVAVPGCGPLLTMSGALMQLDSAGSGAWNYIGYCRAQTDESPPSPQGCQIYVVSDNCVTVVFNNGGTGVLSTACVNQRAVLFSGYCGGAFSPGNCINPGGSPVVGYTDTWDFVSSYSESTCAISQTDNNSRQPNVNCLANVGDPIDIPYDNPTSAYGSGATVTVVSTTEQTIEGNGCLGVSQNYNSYAGTVTADLSNEDTFRNAVVRADAGKTWSTGSCIENPAFGTPQTSAFTFGYRTVEVQALITGLTIGLDYKTTIRFYRRACCGTGTYSFYGSQDISFTATATTETTIWIEINNTDAGYETVAANATTVFVP